MKVLLLLGLVVAAACHSGTNSSQHPLVAQLDSLRGTITIEGSDPSTRVFLTGLGHRTEIFSSAVPFYRIVGLEVQVRGMARDQRFEVLDFRVRASRGQPALDGTLRLREYVRYLAITDGGEQSLPTGNALPTSLVGSRIWLVLSGDGSIVEFGPLEGSH